MTEETKEATSTHAGGCGIRSFRSQVMREAWKKAGSEDISFGEFGKLISQSYAEARKRCGL